MKKIPICLFLCLCICNGKLFAQQQFGVSVMPILMHPLNVDKTVAPAKPMRMGFRGDIMKTKLGIHRFRLSYINFAFSYFPFSKEDVSIDGYGKDTVPDKLFTGILKRSQWDGIFKLGFEIPQHWNDFLYLNIGIGAGIVHGKETYDLPGYDPQKYFLSSTDNGLNIKKGYATLTDEFISAFYEFEKFYVFSQVELIANNCQFTNEGVSIRFNAGIYYTFNKTDK